MSGPNLISGRTTVIWMVANFCCETFLIRIVMSFSQSSLALKGCPMVIGFPSTRISSISKLSNCARAFAWPPGVPAGRMRWPGSFGQTMSFDCDATGEAATISSIAKEMYRAKCDIESSAITLEFTRPRASGHFELIKLHDKHAIAARVQRFVGPSLAIVQTARQQFPTTCETEAFGRSEGQTLARRQEQSHP